MSNNNNNTKKKKRRIEVFRSENNGGAAMAVWGSKQKTTNMKKKKKSRENNHNVLLNLKLENVFNQNSLYKTIYDFYEFCRKQCTLLKKKNLKNKRDVISLKIVKINGHCVEYLPEKKNLYISFT